LAVALVVDSVQADAAEDQASEDSEARPISAVLARVVSVDAAKYLTLNLTNISFNFFL
jgi:hypothetical protein